MEIFVYECGLREGAQAKGVTYSVEDKLKILRTLDEMGVRYVEGGNPASNPKDAAFFEKAKDVPLQNTRLCAFGATRRVGVTADQDEGLQALLAAQTPVVTLFGKSWDLHVETVLKTTLRENLAIIADSVRFFKDNGREVVFDAEHFFDGYLNNPAYAMQTILAAQEAGADCITLCDTNGGAMGMEFYNTVRSVVETLRVPVGVHCHNDAACADANSIIGVQAGATLVQTSILGLGERCGNADFFSVVPNLQLKLGFSCISPQAMETLCDHANELAELLNYAVPESAPYIGKKAFSHKAGMHIDAMQKDHRTFEHIDPAQVGNRRQFLVSEMAGASAVYQKLQQIDPTIEKGSEKIEAVLHRIKELEYQGYQFEGADASFELEAKKVLGIYKKTFELDNFKVVVDEHTERFSSVAMINIRHDGQVEITAAEGEGPVNALDKAIRKALEVFYPQLKNVRLVDYKVRVLNSDTATAAITRVLIETTDGKSTWATVGVSEDILKASFKAITDSLEYYLNK